MVILLECLPCGLTWDCSQSALFAQERKRFCSTSSGVCRYINVLHNLTQRVKDGELWEATGWQGFWLCFSAWNDNHLTTIATHPCCVLSRSLGSAAVHPTYFCRNAHWISLLLPTEGSTSHNWLPPLSGLSPTMCSWLQSCVYGSSEPFSLPTSPFCSHLPTFRYFNEQISQPCSCIGQGILSNSCSNCWNFKERDQGDLSYHCSCNITWMILLK